MEITIKISVETVAKPLDIHYEVHPQTTPAVRTYIWFGAGKVMQLWSSEKDSLLRAEWFIETALKYGIEPHNFVSDKLPETQQQLLLQLCNRYYRLQISDFYVTGAELRHEYLVAVRKGNFIIWTGISTDAYNPIDTTPLAGLIDALNWAITQAGDE